MSAYLATIGVIPFAYFEQVLIDMEANSYHPALIDLGNLLLESQFSSKKQDLPRVRTVLETLKSQPPDFIYDMSGVVRRLIATVFDFTKVHEISLEDCLCIVISEDLFANNVAMMDLSSRLCKSLIDEQALRGIPAIRTLQIFPTWSMCDDAITFLMALPRPELMPRVTL